MKPAELFMCWVGVCHTAHVGGEGKVVKGLRLKLTKIAFQNKEDCWRPSDHSRIEWQLCYTIPLCYAKPDLPHLLFIWVT